MKRNILIGIATVVTIAVAVVAFYYYQFTKVMEHCCAW